MGSGPTLVPARIDPGGAVTSLHTRRHDLLPKPLDEGGERIGGDQPSLDQVAVFLEELHLGNAEPKAVGAGWVALWAVGSWQQRLCQTAAAAPPAAAISAAALHAATTTAPGREGHRLLDRFRRARVEVRHHQLQGLAGVAHPAAGRPRSVRRGAAARRARRRPPRSSRSAGLLGFFSLGCSTQLTQK
jgi:hypothetical protein